MRHKGTFPGGMYLPASAFETTDRPVERLDAPDILRVPFSQGREEPAIPSVKPGDSVTGGQLLAESPNGHSRIHSPVDGHISGFVEVSTAFADRVPAVEIQTHHRGGGTSIAWIDTPSPKSESSDFAGRVREAGCDAPEMEQALDCGGLDHLIISAATVPPYQTASLRTLADNIPLVLEAACYLQEQFDARRTWIAVDVTQPEVHEQVFREARGTPIRTISVSDKYPQYHPRLLALSITKREIPYGNTCVGNKVWVTDVCTALDMWRASQYHVPVAWWTLTISGDAIARPGNYRVPIGMSVQDIAEAIGLSHTPRELLFGNPWSGRASVSPATVVTKWNRSFSLWRSEHYRKGKPTTCIRCGSCLEICPAGLEPRGLLNRAERRQFEAAMELHPQACMGCGLCDYVCPSHLPLMNGVRQCEEYERKQQTSRS